MGSPPSFIHSSRSKYDWSCNFFEKIKFLNRQKEKIISLDVCQQVIVNDLNENMKRTCFPLRVILLRSE